MPSVVQRHWPWLNSGAATNPAILTNRGTVTWNGGNPLYGGFGALVYNHGQWRCTTDGTALDYTGGGDAMVFHNLGTFSKSGGTNETFINTSTFTNRSIVSAASGTLRFGSSSIWETGGQISGSGRVLMNPGAVTLNGTTLLNGSWQWGGANIYGTGGVSGPVPLVWRNARVLGNFTVNPGAQLDFSGDFYPWLNSGAATNPAILTNRGTVTWNGGNPLYGGYGAQVYNLGQWRLDGVGTALDYTGGGGPGTFNNSGTLLKAGAGTVTVNVFTMNNQGRITAEAGQLTFNNPLQASGEFHFPLRGMVAGADYGVLRVNGAYSHAAVLNVEFTNGFTPASGDSFDLVTGNNLSGNFASLVLPTLPPDEGWTVDYAPTVARLRVADACLGGGLISWWPADGNADDQAGSNHGTLQNGATLAPGFIGGAFSLDGVNDGVGSGSWTPGTRWTLQAWVNLRSLQAGRRAILGGLNENRDWALTATGGYLGVTYRSPGGATTTLTNTLRAQTNVWYHLAATYDGLSVAFHQNGALVGTAPAEADYVATAGPRIGSATYNINLENLHGLVDEATIHNRQ